MKCTVCGKEFKPLKENKYTAKSTNYFTKEESEWDCFDCPECGCQMIASKRMPKVEVNK